MLKRSLGRFVAHRHGPYLAPQSARVFRKWRASVHSRRNL